MNKLIVTFPVAVALSVLRCAPSQDNPPKPPGCESVQCGAVSDCDAACERINALGCSEAWGIDPNDGSCLSLCKTADPGICPLAISTASSCDEIDAVSECDQ